LCINRLALVLVDSVDFLNTVDQNDVLLPVVKYLASQRASSIQTLVGDILHCRLPSAGPSDLPSALPAGGLRPGTKCGAGFLASEVDWETDMCSCCGLLIGSPRLEPLSSASRALWPGGSAFATQGSGRALASVRLVAPSLCPEKSGPGLCFLPRNPPGWLWNPAYCCY
jgi:hypothetical protein